MITDQLQLKLSILLQVSKFQDTFPNRETPDPTMTNWSTIIAIIKFHESQI